MKADEDPACDRLVLDGGWKLVIEKLALSEIRLLHSGTVSVGDGYVLLYQGSSEGHSGGVGLLLSPPAVTAWHRAGQRCKSFSSGRLLHATFALAGQEGRWHVISCYGPTLQQSDDEKARFWQDFDSIWDSIPQREVAFSVGDMNCRVAPILIMMLLLKYWDLLALEPEMRMMIPCLTLPLPIVFVFLLHGRQGHEAELASLAAARQAALQAKLQRPDDQVAHQGLQDARRQSRRRTRQLRAEWWQRRVDALQVAFNSRDAGTLYGEAKNLGRLLRNQGMLRSPLVADPDNQPARLAAHFTEVLNVARPVADGLLDTLAPIVNPLPMDHWVIPTMEEFLAARAQLASNKASDSSGVHSELLKALPSDHDVLFKLYSLTYSLWRGELSSDDLTTWHTSTLYPLYQGRGDHSDLQNYRGIVLLDIISKSHSQTLGTGVRQGSVEGPSLYLLYYAFLLRDWRAQCTSRFPDWGVPWSYTIDGSLPASGRARAHIHRDAMWTDTVFADDTLYMETSWSQFQECSQLLDTTLTRYGADMNSLKTEWMEVPGVVHLLIGFRCPAPRFCVYVVKARLLLTCVAPILLHGSEHWVLTASLLHKLCAAWYYFVRTALGVTWQQMRDDRLSHVDLLTRLQVPSLHMLLERRLGTWLGHIARMSSTRMPWQALFGAAAGRISPPSSSFRVRHSYLSRVHNFLLQAPGVDARIWVQQAQDRAIWHRMITEINIAPQNRSTPEDARYTSRPHRRGYAVVQPDDVVTCPFCGCGYVARNAQGLKARINRKHPAETTAWKCDHCDRTFNQRSSLTVHLESCGPNAVVAAPAAARPARARTDGPRNFSCTHPHCTATFKDKSALGRHMREKCLSRPGSGAVWHEGCFSSAMTAPSNIMDAMSGLGAASNSLVAKRPRSAPGMPRPEEVALNNADLTRAFLQHEQELRALHHALTLAFKFAVDTPLSKLLLDAVRAWQSEHKKGKAHPFGACGTATATILFKSVLEFCQAAGDQKLKSTACVLLAEVMGCPTPAVVAGEVAHCSARLSKQETHMILELRFPAASVFAPHAARFKLVLTQMKGEMLGAKPMSGLARRARGLHP
eukprot:s395_g18.t1